MKAFSAKEHKFFIHPIAILIWIWLAFVFGGIFAINYFVAILIHEFGHYITAKKQGYALSQFSFSPYGVTLSYFGQNFEATDEIKIALAGPVFNLASCLFVVGIWWLFPTVFVFTDSFVIISVCLALLNLLPAYPLDGGRVFVCVASKFLSEKTSKRMTMIFNIVLSVIFLLLFFFFCFINFNPTYFLFAFFLIVGMLDLEFSTKYEKINIFNKCQKDFSKPRFVLVSSNVTIGQIMRKIQSSDTKIFCYILENGKIINLSEKMILKLSLKFPFNEKLENIFK